MLSQPPLSAAAKATTPNTGLGAPACAARLIRALVATNRVTNAARKRHWSVLQTRKSTGAAGCWRVLATSCARKRNWSAVARIGGASAMLRRPTRRSSPSELCGSSLGRVHFHISNSPQTQSALGSHILARIILSLIDVLVDVLLTLHRYSGHAPRTSDGIFALTDVRGRVGYSQVIQSERLVQRVYAGPACVVIGSIGR